MFCERGWRKETVRAVSLNILTAAKSHLDIFNASLGSLQNIKVKDKLQLLPKTKGHRLPRKINNSCTKNKKKKRKMK